MVFGKMTATVNSPFKHAKDFGKQVIDKVVQGLWSKEGAIEVLKYIDDYLTNLIRNNDVVVGINTRSYQREIRCLLVNLGYKQEQMQREHDVIIDYELGRFHR